jgi:hypothetical protein
MALYISGVVTTVVGVALGIALDPILFVIAAIGLSDFVLGWLFATDRIGPGAARRKAAASGEAAAMAESDPSFNPYARED